MIAGSGSVITDVIRLKPSPTNKTMFSISKLYLGIALHCLSIAGIVVYFIAEDARKHDTAELKHNIASLTERIDSLPVYAIESDNVVASARLNAETTTLKQELADIQSRLSRPAYLSDIAFVTWAILSISGSVAFVMSASDQRKSNKIGSQATTVG